MSEKEPNLKPQFNLQSIYIKDVSFESPHAPEIFSEPIEPDLNIDFKLESKALKEGFFEVSLKLTVNLTAKNKKITFVAEVEQAGIFQVSGLSEVELKGALAVNAPYALYPYARECVSSLVMRGGFAQFYLPPINFEALYQDSLKKQNSLENARQNPITTD